MPRLKRASRRYLPVFEPLELRIVLSDESAGYNGVNARGLTTPGGALPTGSNVNIRRKSGRDSFSRLALV